MDFLTLRDQHTVYVIAVTKGSAWASVEEDRFVRYVDLVGEGRFPSSAFCTTSIYRNAYADQGHHHKYT